MAPNNTKFRFKHILTTAVRWSWTEFKIKCSPIALELVMMKESSPHIAACVQNFDSQHTSNARTAELRDVSGTMEHAEKSVTESMIFIMQMSLRNNWSMLTTLISRFIDLTDNDLLPLCSAVRRYL